MTHTHSRDLHALPADLPRCTPPQVEKTIKQTDDLALMGSLAGVMAFGPILSVAVLTAKFTILHTFEALSVKKTPLELIILQRAAARARLTRLGVLTRDRPSVNAAARRHTAAAAAAVDAMMHPNRGRSATTGNLAVNISA